jgi:hypothetical protein
MPALAVGMVRGAPTAWSLREIESPRILRKAADYLDEPPRTVTADHCGRSEGGPHDYFSEGDYWWPDPKNPGGPYIRRDGETNPDNFIAHRESMIRLSEIVGTLVSAYLLTGEEKYAARAVAHLKAWFVDPATRMNPHLMYSQAIYGRETGRSIGIIDTIHLCEVARGAKLLADSETFTTWDRQKLKEWFRAYLDWLNTHPYGVQERRHPNNHSVCWCLQAAAFADLLGDEGMLASIRRQFKSDFLPELMNAGGGFPAEIARTKPYGYSLFMIDAIAGVAWIASTPEDDLWTFTTGNGRSVRKGMEFIVPYIRNKDAWPGDPDVMHWDDWPVRQPSLFMAGLKFERPDFLALWRGLEADPEVFEVLRNLPLRHPLLWVDHRW